MAKESFLASFWGLDNEVLNIELILWRYDIGQIVK